MQKQETIRRLRYGNLRKLIQFRHGIFLPDDDAGREYLRLLLDNLSTAKHDPESKMRHAIDMLAPWMFALERERMVEFMGTLEYRERIIGAEAVGEAVRLTNEERTRLGLWLLHPIDAEKVDLVEQRKARAADRRRARRRANGVKSREVYLASSLSQQRPWEAEGISRRTWERKRVASVVPTNTSVVGSDLRQSPIEGVMHMEDTLLNASSPLPETDLRQEEITPEMKERYKNVLERFRVAREWVGSLPVLVEPAIAA
jgi:hypothetical protein